MTNTQRILMTVMRIAFGVLFLFAAYQKFTSVVPWTAAGYLAHAQTFGQFYAWLGSDSMIGLTNFLNLYGQIAVGLALILGLSVRLFGFLGAVMMVLYYFPILKGLYPNEHSLIVDEHIIYALALLLLSSFRAGRIWGLDRVLKPWYDKHRLATKFLG